MDATSPQYPRSQQPVREPVLMYGVVNWARVEPQVGTRYAVAYLSKRTPIKTTKALVSRHATREQAETFAAKMNDALAAGLLREPDLHPYRDIIDAVKIEEVTRPDPTP